MSIHLVPNLPRLIAMVATFSMCERKVSNLIYYFVVNLFLFILCLRPVAAGCSQSIFFINVFISKRIMSNFSMHKNII